MCLNNLGRNKTDSRNTFSKVFQIHRHQAVFFCPKIPEATNCKPQPELSRKLVGGWPKSHKTLRQPSPRTINKTRCSYRAPVTEYCIPGALPQVYESLGFQPVNGTNVSTALIADAFIQSVPTQQVVNQTNCRNTLQMRPPPGNNAIWFCNPGQLVIDYYRYHSNIQPIIHQNRQYFAGKILAIVRHAQSKWILKGNPNRH